MKLNPILLRDVRNAYSDCNGTKHERNLNFRASDWVSIDEAVELMDIALGKMGGYNNFRPELLERLPGDPQIILARENSVCVYVVSLVTLDECVIKDLLKADECHLKTIDFDGQKISAYRIWWD
jgi:hypothetical protein